MRDRTFEVAIHDFCPDAPRGVYDECIPFASGACLAHGFDPEGAIGPARRRAADMLAEGADADAVAREFAVDEAALAAPLARPA